MSLHPSPIDPDHPVEAWLVALVFALLMLLGMEANSDEPATVERVDAAILHLVTVGIPEHRVKPWPRSPIAVDADRRHQLASAISHAASEHGVDPFILVTIALREGSFITRRQGGLGEVSIFQMTPRSVEFATRLDPKCHLDDVLGQARCAAALLSHWRKRCGSTRGAVLMYATGRTCTADTDHLRWLADDRMGIAEKLRAL